MLVTCLAASGRSSCRPRFVTCRLTVFLEEAELHGQATMTQKGYTLCPARNIY
jgi:hypothetical protein